MPQKNSSISNVLRGSIRSKILIGAIVLIALGIGGYYSFSHRAPAYQFVTAQKGSITELVSLTGNVTPSQSVSLTFGSSGIISRIYSELGKRVHTGQLLAELNTNDLIAGLHQAQANVAVQQAKLEGLQSGSRPEDIAVSQAALDKAKQDLVNMYDGISDTSISSYAKANDAVRVQLDQFFSNSETQNAKLTYTTTNYQAQVDAEAQRPPLTVLLNKWQDQIANIDQSNAGLEALLQDEISYLASVRQFLNSISKTLDNTISLSAATLTAYKDNVSAALTEVNTATEDLNVISQDISSQKLTVSHLQAQLDLKLAGSLPSDISAQQAQVEQAKASVESAAAKLLNAQIISPINGTVTQFDAKVGQLASVSTPLISAMSDSGYEVDAGVSETDVGKISAGDTVVMTLDAFQNETFTGSVFYIAPAETNIQGVVSYQIKISFDKPDSRLKSGLTANIDIQTKHRDNVLILPQYAILQNDQGTFVEVLENGKVKQNPVTLGIRDQNGNVEVISGVTEGEQVLNIGLKAQ